VLEPAHLRGSEGEQMKTGRVLIGAVLFLGAGIWVIFTYCNGTVGLNFGYPISTTKITVDITTVGVPVIVGIPLVGFGMLLMTVAFIAAIVAQFRRPRVVAKEDVSPRRDMPFEE
jgi:hypothetical protein